MGAVVTRLTPLPPIHPVDPLQWLMNGQLSVEIRSVSDRFFFHFLSIFFHSLPFFLSLSLSTSIFFLVNGSHRDEWSRGEMQKASAEESSDFRLLLTFFLSNPFLLLLLLLLVLVLLLLHLL